MNLQARLDGEAATLAFGAALAHALPPGARNPFVILLSGELGAGKTTFVRGLAEGLGLDPDDVSDLVTRVRDRVAAPFSVGVTVWHPHEDLYSAIARADSELLDRKRKR